MIAAIAVGGSTGERFVAILANEFGLDRLLELVQIEIWLNREGDRRAREAQVVMETGIVEIRSFAEAPHNIVEGRQGCDQVFQDRRVVADERLVAIRLRGCVKGEEAVPFVGDVTTLRREDIGGRRGVADRPRMADQPANLLDQHARIRERFVEREHRATGIVDPFDQHELVDEKAFGPRRQVPRHGVENAVIGPFAEIMMDREDPGGPTGKPRGQCLVHFGD